MDAKKEVEIWCFRKNCLSLSSQINSARYGKTHYSLDIKPSPFQGRTAACERRNEKCSGRFEREGSRAFGNQRKHLREIGFQQLRHNAGQHPRVSRGLGRLCSTSPSPCCG